MKKILNFLSKILSVLIIFFIIKIIFNLRHDIDFIDNLKLEYLFFTIFLALTFFAMESILFQTLLNAYQKTTYSISFGLTVVSYFLNLVIPFSAIGFRYFFLKKKYNFSFKNFINLSLSFYIINFSIIILTLNYFFFIQKNFIIDFYNINLFIPVLSFIILLISNYILIFKKKINILNKSFYFKSSKKVIFESYIFSFIMYLIYFLMIHICILGVDNNFDKYHISILLGSLAEILFIFQITPAAIGTIEAIFYMILKNISFDNNSIILVITQFRLSLLIIIVGLGSVFFYKFFKLSMKNIK